MRRGLPRDERGVTLVLMVLFMTLILGMAALTIDYGMVKSEKAEAQRAGDAAALAGASSLIVANGRDASASWDDATNTVAGSTAGANWLTDSPRVIIVGLYNPSQYGGCPSCNTVQLNNLAKVFLDRRTCSGHGACKEPVTGRFLGFVTGSSPTGSPTGSLVKRIALIK